MAAIPHRRSVDAFPLFLLIILAARCADSQPPATGNSNNATGINNNSNNGQYLSSHFNPYTVIIIVVLISAFFLLGFFSIYIRQCSSDRADVFGAPLTGGAAGRIRLQRGIDREVLESFPTLVYSEVKEHKIGKGALECAICLNEFEDDETIRLLPNCDHVFHQECIDAWLDTHVTCPVCRTNYSDYVSSDLFSGGAQGGDFEVGVPAVVPEIVVPVAQAADRGVDLVDDVEERKEEMRELARIASKRRGVAGRRSRRLSRSHSTGHCMMPKANGEVGIDRYTLRLPENVRKEIIAAGKLKRAKTFEVACSGDGGARRISRGGGEGSSRRTRTVRLGRSDRWPSFFVRSLSAKMSAWGAWRKGDDGSLSRKVSGVRIPATVAAGYNADDFSDESSTAALNKV